MKIFQRVLHGLAVMAVMLMAALIAFVVLVAWGLVLMPDDRHYVEWAMVAVAVILLLLVTIGIWKRVWYRWLFPTGIVLAGSLAWLAHDETRGYEPQIFEPFATKDSKGFQALVWMVRDVPGSRLKDRNGATPLTNGLRLPSTNKEWVGYVTAHRAEIEAAWEQDKIGKEWIAVLVSTEPSGLVPDQIKNSMLNFSIVREIFEIRFLNACAYFAEGQSDEAAQILAESIAALGKISRGGGPMVNEMISAVLLKRAFFILNHFLDSTSFSLERKSQLLAALKDVAGGAEIAKLMFYGERLYAHQTVPDNVTKEFAQMLSSELILQGFHTATREVIGSICVSRFLINQRGAGRRYDEVLQRISVAAQDRNMKALNHILSHAKENRLDSFMIKDPLGRLLTVAAIPAFEKVVGRTWEIDDQRLELIKRLEATKP